MRPLACAAALWLLAAPAVGQRTGMTAGQAPARQGGRQARQQRETRPEARPEDLGSVEGMVVNAKTGEPVRRAQVTLASTQMPPLNYGAATDAGGRFKIEGVEPGGYRVNAARNGFARDDFASRGASQSSKVLNVAVRQTVRDIVLRLTPAAVITGIVLDEEAEPLANARVQALRYRYLQGRKQLSPAGFATTDDQGRYRIFGLAPAQYYVSVSYTDPRGAAPPAMGARTDGGAQDEGYAPVYYPGSLDPTQALPVPLRAGDERHGIDFKLSPVRTVRVRGRVLNAPQGSVGRNVSVSLMPRLPAGIAFSQRSFSRVERDSTFEIRGVVPGSYILSANTNVQGTQLSARLPLDVGSSGVEGADLTLKPGLSLKGVIRVEDSTGAPLALGTAGVVLRSRDDSALISGGIYDRSEQGNSFTLREVFEGDYSLVVQPMPEDCYLKRIRFGNADLPDTDITITEAAASTVIEVILRKGAGNLEGSVSDDAKDFANLTVALVPAPPRRARLELYKTASVDESGRFSITGIAPGEYKVFAFGSLEPGAHQDPSFLQPYEDKGTSVTVEEKGRHNVNLTAIRLGEPAR